MSPGQTISVFMLRINGVVEEVFTDAEQAEDYMRKHRKTGQFWKIHERKTVPHKEAK